MEAPVPVTDPAVLEAIEAEFTLSVYEAARRAARQMAGLEAPPARRPSLRRPPHLLTPLHARETPPEAHGGAPSRRSARRALLSRLLSTARRAVA